MIALDSGDKIRGDASAATVVDYTIHGLDANAIKQLADGQLAAAIGDLYTADSADVVSSIILVNTDSSARTVNLYLTPNSGTARRLIPKDMSLGIGYCLIFDGSKIGVYDASGNLQQTVTVSAHASTHDSGGADQVHSIADNDGNTKIQVEESADENIIRMDTAGTEAFHLSAIGVLTLAKQSRARPALTVDDQTIPDNADTRVRLDFDTYDEQNESNVTVKAGTADATQANKLHDADGGFAASDVGAAVWNTTDNTYAVVTAFVDSGELTLDTDIMVNGETYDLYHSRFTATEDGYYSICGGVFHGALGDGHYASADIKINGTYRARSYFLTSFAGNLPSIPVGTNYYLAANDYVELWTYQNSGGAVAILKGTGKTWMAIHKLS